MNQGLTIENLFLASWRRILGFWDSILSICAAILGISKLFLSLWESVLGFWKSIFRPLDVVCFCLWGLILGFWESILSFWVRFWDSLGSDVGSGGPFWNSGSHFYTWKANECNLVLMLCPLELIMGLWEIIFDLRESTVGLWESILGVNDSI